jgi:hypothetical protein
MRNHDDYDDLHATGGFSYPKHPVREGVTVAICLAGIIALVLWLLYKVV